MTTIPIVLIVFGLLCLSALFSGLTLSLLGMNVSDLERKKNLGDKMAIRVYSLRKRGNLLLCTFLVGNMAVNSTIAIFLGDLMKGVYAGLIATALLVVFGEVLPQATFPRFALKIGGKVYWVAKFFVYLFYPVCAPMAWTLDKMLGEELPTIWSREELKEIIKLHENSPYSSIDADEERIVLGALSFSDKQVSHIMTPRRVMFSLEINTELNKKMLEEIKKLGFTRIPVYDGVLDNVVGVLYSKDLIGIDPDENLKVGIVYRKDHLLIVPPDRKLDEMLNMFIKTKTHLAFVVDEFGGLAGIVSLEDVIEEVLRVEIVDEADISDDLQKIAREKFGGHNKFSSPQK